MSWTTVVWPDGSRGVPDAGGDLTAGLVPAACGTGAFVVRCECRGGGGGAVDEADGECGAIRHRVALAGFAGVGLADEAISPELPPWVGRGGASDARYFNACLAVPPYANW